MLRCIDLSVRYPRGPLALDAVSLTLPPGIFGLLGPNGAGKSSLLRVLATLQRPDRGTITFDDGGPSAFDVLGDPARLRAQLGFLPQDFGLYPTLTVDNVLDHFCALKGAADRAERRAWVEDLLSRTNLLDRRHQVVASLSGGMRQRLGIAIALAGTPRLLLLDEPTAGLDPGERRRIYELLGAVGGSVVVLLSTHYIEDVRAVCARFAILHRGRLVLEDTPHGAVAAARAAHGPLATLEDAYFAHVPPADTA